MAKPIDIKSSATGGLPVVQDENSATYYHEDPVTGDITLEDVMDATDLVEHNVAVSNNYDERTPWNLQGMGLNRVASIPMNVFMELKKKGIVDDKKAFRRWLNDRDNRVFRTRPGVV